MPRFLPALVLAAIALSACDAGGSDLGATSGLWAGTASFEVDTLMQDQNFRVVGDYDTRYEFDLTEDEDGLVLGFMNIYNTGTLTVREPRNVGGTQTVIEHEVVWDDDLIHSWPVYGTYGRPTLEVDLPEAEAANVFPKDLWTFTVTGDRARLQDKRILHGYTFAVFEDYDSPHTFALSPSNEDEFRMERQ
ncbi:hypothetical protein [Rubrivirga sp. IMCC45206]|uniref:hypothetical protein n=1 Tax=Rubrivirga sp. IMCC45206 TaxID=3391614 RepID=UPI00398FB88C